MKPPRFEYDDPTSVDEVLALLAEHGDNAKLLAGGQSLVPLLNFRLARPERLIDLNRVDELSYVRRENGSLRIGAMTRQATLEKRCAAPDQPGTVPDGPAPDDCPLMTEALALVGHPQIRNRGTVGGSVAHADPAAELPVALCVLDARFHVRSARGTRTLAPGELFVTHLTTTLEPDKLLTEIEVPLAPPRSAVAFEEFARRHGDFALGGAAVQLSVDETGSCDEARIGLLAAAPTPLRVPTAEQALVGASVADERERAEAAREARALTEAAISPTGDMHGSGEYRRHLIGAMVERALLRAATTLAASE